MAGIYVHIPFCKQKCTYCNFHFSISQSNKKALLEAMHKEIELRKDYLPQPLESIYFGGGTPSILETEDISGIIQSIHTHHQVSPNAEITLEANPDDLTKEKLEDYAKLGVNRLSIGIQSFDDKDLQQMNRAHNATESLDSIKLAQQVGFNNISIDLIYGVPGTDMQHWIRNVETALARNIQHVSAYALTVEPKTLLNHQVITNKIVMPDPDDVSDQFLMLVKLLSAAGFDQYEVSNFGKKTYYSQHNTSYWKSEPYIGIGPSAHSFDGKTRQWNIANNHGYIRAITNKESYFNQEKIDTATAFNEYVMLGLRTAWGIDLEYIKKEFDQHILQDQPEWRQRYNAYFHISKNKLTLNSEGLLMADRIASDLMIV